MLGKLVNIFTKSNSTVVVNGVTYTGKGSVCISSNGNVTIGGKSYNSDLSTKCEIKIDIHGSADNISTTSGDVKCENANSVSTTSGDVEVRGSVYGNVSTTSGDVDTKSVSGSVSTVSGDIGV